MTQTTTEDEIRFWSKVDRKSETECWPWMAGRHSAGYGAFSVRMPGGGFLMKPAHQFAALLALGPSDGRYVLHACDNRICCNPSHLRYGTQRDNVHDAISRERHVNPPRNAHYRKHNAPKGDALWNQSLTETEVREIWRLHLSGQNATQISKSVGHPVHVVVDACRGRSWRHLADAPSIETLRSGGVRRDKLTDEDITNAKAMLAAGMMVKSVAAHFGVSTAPISNLKNYGTTWVPKP